MLGKRKITSLGHIWKFGIFLILAGVFFKQNYKGIIKLFFKKKKNFRKNYQNNFIHQKD